MKIKNLDSMSQGVELEEQVPGEIARAHHQIKNTLQNVISLINIMYRRKNHLGDSEVKRLIGHIKCLSSLHDILRDQVESTGKSSFVRFNSLVESIIAYTIDTYARPITLTKVNECYVSAREATTIVLIFNELLNHVCQHGSGEIIVGVECDGGRGILSVINEEANPPIDFSIDSSALEDGLILAKVLSQSDLGSCLVLKTAPPHATIAEVSFICQHSIQSL